MDFKRLDWIRVNFYGKKQTGLVRKKLRYELNLRPKSRDHGNVAKQRCRGIYFPLQRYQPVSPRWWSTESQTWRWSAASLRSDPQPRSVNQSGPRNLHSSFVGVLTYQEGWVRYLTVELLVNQYLANGMGQTPHMSPFMQNPYHKKVGYSYINGQWPKPCLIYTG